MVHDEVVAVVPWLVAVLGVGPCVGGPHAPRRRLALDCGARRGRGVVSEGRAGRPGRLRRQQRHPGAPERGAGAARGATAPAAAAAARRAQVARAA